MYEYLNAASMMESRRTAELNRRLEIRRIALERIALERIAEHRTDAQRPAFGVRLAAGIRHLLPHTTPRHAHAARRTHAARQA